MPARYEFTAYGQACLRLAHEMFSALVGRKAVLFAAAIPRGCIAPRDSAPDEILRKDHVFLLERYFYFLESKAEHGLLVMDEVEKEVDRTFVRKLHAYLARTETGRHRTQWIVPSPLFVSPDLTPAVQAADLAMYVVNRGFRMPSVGMNAQPRPEIVDRYGEWIHRLQFHGEGYRRGDVFRTHGIVFVPDLYTSRDRM